MAKFVIEVSATSVRHDVERWMSKLNKEIAQAMKSAEVICQQAYKRFTNKSTGRIKSTHISEMLRVKSQEVKGAQKGKSFEMQVYLEGKPRWIAAAEKQEVGGVIRPKQSKLLTIPNIKAGVSPYAIPRHFGNRAVWRNSGGTPVLVRGKGKVTKRREPRKLTKPKRRNAPKKRQDFSGGNDILFWGVKSVYLKPKRFFEDSIAEASQAIERDLSNRLSAFYRRV